MDAIAMQHGHAHAMDAMDGWMRWIDGGYAMDAIAIQHSHAHAMDAMDGWMRWMDGCDG